MLHSSTTAAAAALTVLLAVLGTPESALAGATPKRTYTLHQKFGKVANTNVVQQDMNRRIAQGWAGGPPSASVKIANAAGSVASPAAVGVSAAAGPSDGTDVTIFNGFSSYYINMGVGVNQQNFYCLVDTGSANTWVTGSNYVKTSSAVDTGLIVGQNYGIGLFRGYSYTDTVSFVGEPGEGTIQATGQGIGIEYQQQGFDGIGGILGLAPALQTINSQKDTNGNVVQEIIPTVVDTLAAQGEIPAAIVGLSLIPTTSSTNPGTGTVTFGGVSYNDFVGSIKYFPKEQEDFIAPYWGFSTSSVTFDILNPDGASYTTTQLLDGKKYGIIDSGATLVALPQTVFNEYVASFPGSYVDTQTSLLLIPAEQVPRIGNMTFTLGEEQYVFTPSAQLLPSEISPLFGLPAPDVSGYYASVFSGSGVSMDTFTLGMYFLDRFYAVFDTPNQRIGLAYTEYTFEKTTELTASRRAKRAHRTHEKRHEWSDGKARLDQLISRSPFGKHGGIAV